MEQCTNSHNPAAWCAPARLTQSAFSCVLIARDPAKWLYWFHLFFVRHCHPAFARRFLRHSQAREVSRTASQIRFSRQCSRSDVAVADLGAKAPEIAASCPNRSNSCAARHRFRANLVVLHDVAHTRPDQDPDEKVLGAVGRPVMLDGSVAAAALETRELTPAARRRTIRSHCD